MNRLPRPHRPRAIAPGAFVAVLVAASATSAAAAPKKRIACTLTTVEAIVREVGGDRVETFSLSAGDQDPHFVAPTPSLMKKVREADALVEIGMQLEMWADEVANGSGNSRLFRGGPGRFQVSTGIPKLEVPSVISRAQGDIHPEGNPHIWLDPVRVKLMADNVARALGTMSPDDAKHFEAKAKEFQKRLDRALFGEELLSMVGAAKLSRLSLDGRLHDFLIGNELDGRKLAEMAGGWLKKAAPLRGEKVVEVHKVRVCFAQVFGFSIIGTIEEKPGIPPGPKHVAATEELVKSQQVRLILVDNFYDPSLPQRIARDTGVKALILPNQVRGEPGIDDYFSLIDHVLSSMVEALPNRKGTGRP